MYLRYMHGAFNLSVALLVFYQFALGRGLMKATIAGQADPERSKRHRRIGPIAVAAGVLGFTAGTTLIMLDKGSVLVYPVHFVTGALIALLLVSAFMLSIKMGSGDPLTRKQHGKVGMGIATLYLVQVIVGLGILL